MQLIKWVSVQPCSSLNANKAQGPKRSPLLKNILQGILTGYEQLSKVRSATANPSRSRGITLLLLFIIVHSEGFPLKKHISEILARTENKTVWAMQRRQKNI